MMSDSGLGRPAESWHDAPRPSWLDGSTYSYPLPFPLVQAIDADRETLPADGQSPGRSGHPREDRPPGDGRDGSQPAVRYPFAGLRDQFGAPVPQPAVPPRGSHHPWPPAPDPAALVSPAQGTEERTAPGGRRARGGRRWPVLAGVVAAGAAVGVTAVLLARGRPGMQGAGGAVAPSATASVPSATSMAVRASAKPSPGAAAGVPLTLAQAEAVTARYSAVNNRANAQRSDTLLATVETGSSYAIDATLYLTQKAAGKAPYPAFGPVQTTYYIPRGEPAAGPRWFVAQVANAFLSSPAKVTSDEYLLFAQQAPGGPWLDAAEPYLLAAASAPQVKLGADGLAAAVSPDATAVAVAPGQLPAATAASLNGSGQAAVTVPGNPADVSDQRFWRGKLAGGQVTDVHSPAGGTAGQEFALQTADGGALVFYADTARVTVTPPPGTALRLTVPGLYPPGQALTRATVSYLDQFAAYDPPAGSGKAPSVVAGYSGITGKG